MAEVKSYALVAASGVVINVIAWDGESQYAIPPGTKLVQSNTAGIGHTYDEATGEFTNHYHDAVLVPVTPDLVVE